VLNEVTGKSELGQQVTAKGLEAASLWRRKPNTLKIWKLLTLPFEALL